MDFQKSLDEDLKKSYYVDGFAGRGIYDNGEKGSPVLAAEASLAYQQGNMPFTLLCINVEKVHENFTNLCTETKRFGNLVQNIQGTFETTLIYSNANREGNLLFSSLTISASKAQIGMQ